MAYSKRPLAVSIVGWYLVIASIGSIVTLPILLYFPEGLEAYRKAGIAPTTAAITAIVGSLVCIVAGIAMMRGRAWGRTLWALYGLLSLVYTAWLYKFQSMALVVVLPGILVAVTIYFLTRPNVNAYFAGEVWQVPEETVQESGMPQEPARPPRALWMKVVGVILLVFAGLFLYMLMIFAASVPANQIKQALPSLAVFAALLASFAGAGMFLWGYWRWKILSGILLVCAGGIMLLIGLVLLQSDAFMNGSPKVDPVAMALMGKKALLVGLPAVAGGIWLILRQRTNDKKA